MKRTPFLILRRGIPGVEVRYRTERSCGAGAGLPILIQHLKIGSPTRLQALVSKLLAVRRKGEA